ncbi:MAG: TetR/AcrR family transcriptional regulator [Burkholderiaceae bacterium]|nr:TetR/AcrR family transcriptional regulator [Burkholderiaceae bacterium]
MKPAAKAGRPSEASRLNRDDWLDAAFDAVVEGGFERARVLALAQSLGVTRGSFYWHFADHAELIDALLARWREGEHEVVRRLQGEFTGAPQADLLLLLDAALARAGADLENMRFELALRGLGRRDPDVARMLVQVDSERMALFEDRFARLTGERHRAGELAALFYLAIVGSHQALSRPSSTARIAGYLKGIIGEYLIRQQARPTDPGR